MPDESAAAVELADRVSALLYAVADWVTVGFGLALGAAAVGNVVSGGLSLSAGLLAALFLTFAFVLVSLGLFVNPEMRRRLNRRHGLSRFGRVRTVDHRVIRSDERCPKRCVDCRDRINGGLVGRYREEYAVAGLPVYTRSEGHNYYCLECASADVLGEDPADAPTTDSVADKKTGAERLVESDGSN